MLGRRSCRWFGPSEFIVECEPLGTRVKTRQGIWHMKQNILPVFKSFHPERNRTRTCSVLVMYPALAVLLHKNFRQPYRSCIETEFLQISLNLADSLSEGLRGSFKSVICFAQLFLLLMPYFIPSFGNNL